MKSLKNFLLLSFFLAPTIALSTLEVKAHRITVDNRASTLGQKGFEERRQYHTNYYKGSSGEICHKHNGFNSKNMNKTGKKRYKCSKKN